MLPTQPQQTPTAQYTATPGASDPEATRAPNSSSNEGPLAGSPAPAGRTPWPPVIALNPALLHTPTETRPILAERFRTKMCRNHVEHGSCPYEARCMFAHGEHELRDPATNFRDGLLTETAIRSFQHQQQLLLVQQHSSEQETQPEPPAPSPPQQPQQQQPTHPQTATNGARANPGNRGRGDAGGRLRTTPPKLPSPQTAAGEAPVAGFRYARPDRGPKPKRSHSNPDAAEVVPSPFRHRTQPGESAKNDAPRPRPLEPPRRIAVPDERRPQRQHDPVALVGEPPLQLPPLPQDQPAPEMLSRTHPPPSDASHARGRAPQYWHDPYTSRPLN